jgi:hypothetical protein
VMAWEMRNAFLATGCMESAEGAGKR